MKNTRPLSKREQILIYIMIVVVILAVGWYFLIGPQLDKYNSQTSELDTLNGEYATLQSTGNYKDVNKNLKAALEKYAQLAENYASPMKSEDVDVMLTMLAESDGYTPFSLEIGEATSTEVVPYGTATTTSGTTNSSSTTSSSSTSSNSTSTSNSSSSSSSSSSKSSYPSIDEIKVTQVIKGDFATINTFIADVKKLNSVEIQSMNFSDENTDTTTGEQQITFTYIIYVLAA